MWLKVVLGIALFLAALGLIGAAAIRALRKYVRSVWPHS
jgi:hypothetical protein